MVVAKLGISQKVTYIISPKLNRFKVQKGKIMIIIHISIILMQIWSRDHVSEGWRTCIGGTLKWWLPWQPGDRNRPVTPSVL